MSEFCVMKYIKIQSSFTEKEKVLRFVTAVAVMRCNEMPRKYV